MYTPPRRHPVRLLSDSGRVWTYDSLLSFIQAHGREWIRSFVGPHFRVVQSLDAFGERLTRHYGFILRSDEDTVITAEDCERAWRIAHPRRTRWRACDAFWAGGGPVPGTGKIPAGQHYFRTIRTFGSQRAARGVVQEDGEPLFRPARDAALPSAWDDHRVAARADRSWKRFRRTRWRTAPASLIQQKRKPGRKRPGE